MIMTSACSQKTLPASLHDQRFPRDATPVTTSGSSSRSVKPSKIQPTDKPAALRLLLICHGEGMQHRYSGIGNMNSGLTARGWEEVEALSNWLRTHEPVRAVISGPRLQSRLTAQRIGQAMRTPVSVLREPVRITQRPATSDQAHRETESTARDGEAPGPSASGATASQTTANPFDEILAAHPDGAIALVASPDNIRAMLRELMSANDTGIDIDHTGLTGLRQKGGMWSIAYVNRREHLPAPIVTSVDEKEQTAKDAEQEEDIASIVAVYDRVARDDVAAKATDDRERIRGLLDFAKLPQGLDILDAGTGLGVLAQMLAEEGAASVIGVDVSPGMLEQAEYLRLSAPMDSMARVSYRLARLQTLPFPDDRFDAVTSRLVLSHFHAPERIVREFVRVLKPGGIFLMAELLSVDDPVKRATQNAIEERRNPSHVAARSAEQYDKMLTDAGLDILNTASVSITRNLREWLDAYRTPDAVAATVIEMVEAGLETDAAGIGARRRGDRIEFQQRMYYSKAAKPSE